MERGDVRGLARRRRGGKAYAVDRLLTCTWRICVIGDLVCYIHRDFREDGVAL